MSPYPDWLRILSWAYLSVSFACAAIIIGDELRRPQKMMIMSGRLRCFTWGQRRSQTIVSPYASPTSGAICLSSSSDR
jgi:hypothetical protein